MESTADVSQGAPFAGGEAVELAVYFDSQRPGAASSFYATLETEYADRGVRISHRLTPTESFGRSRRVRKDTSPERDPPLVVIAVDARPTISAALASFPSSVADILVTLCPTEIVSGTAHALHSLGAEPTALVVHCRRGRSRHDPLGVGGVVEQLRRDGVAGATALGRGEGTIAGHRHRPGLLSPAADGPMMVVSIDHADVFARVIPSLFTMPQIELITVKPVFLCKWQSRRQDPPTPTADTPPWSQITLYATGEAWLDWRPQHSRLVARLRQLGAPGVTVLRGTIGYALNDPPRSSRKRFEHPAAPTVTTIIDTPNQAGEWLRAINELTDRHGLVTHEFVAAHRLM